MHLHHLRLSVGFQQTVQRTHFPPPPLHLYWLQKFLLWSLTSSQKTRPAEPYRVLGTGVVAALWTAVKTGDTLRATPVGTRATPHLS